MELGGEVIGDYFPHLCTGPKWHPIPTFNQRPMGPGQK
jgi:hypothetical protein